MTVLSTSGPHDPPVSGPLGELLETYSQCLAMSRDYAEAAFENDANDGDLDENSLRHFLSARAELFAAAEGNLDGLGLAGEAEDDDPQRREVTRKVIAILKEMTEIENQLAAFLGEHLSKMRRTISHLATSQTIFTRYGQLGTQKPESHITRHE